MVYDGVLKGQYVYLKSCNEDDAEFTLSLRKDPELGKFFPALNKITVDEQREWIRSQRRKEGDYFFVVWNKDDVRIGTIGLSDIDENSGEGGRIIFREGNPYEVSEAQLLIDRFAFDVLNLSVVRGTVFADNHRAIKFSRRFSGHVYDPERDNEGKLVVRAKTTRDEFVQIDKIISAVLYH